MPSMQLDQIGHLSHLSDPPSKGVPVECFTVCDTCYLRRLDSFDCHKLAMYMLSNGKKILLLFCELFLQFHNNLHLGCNAGDFYEYSMTFYMKDKTKCVIPLIIPEYFK